MVMVRPKKNKTPAPCAECGKVVVLYCKGKCRTCYMRPILAAHTPGRTLHPTPVGVIDWSGITGLYCCQLCTWRSHIEWTRAATKAAGKLHHDTEHPTLRYKPKDSA